MLMARVLVTVFPSAKYTPKLTETPNPTMMLTRTNVVNKTFANSRRGEYP